MKVDSKLEGHLTIDQISKDKFKVTGHHHGCSPREVTLPRDQLQQIADLYLNQETPVNNGPLEKVVVEPGEQHGASVQSWNFDAFEVKVTCHDMKQVWNTLKQK